MGLFAGTRTSTALIDLLIWASKTNALEMQGFGSNKRDQILGWAIIMFNNPTATQKLANDARITDSEAHSILLRMKQAARELAAENRADTLVYIATESDKW
jgi:guanylate kinase